MRSLVRYQLFAQNRDGSLIIKALGKDQLFSMNAHEVLAEKKFLSGFAPADAAIIGYIACSEDDKRLCQEMKH